MAKKYSKYRVDTSDKGKQDRTYKGITYDSKTEMLFVKEFIEPKIESGEILKFERQVTYVLQDGFVKDGQKILPVKYKSDFDVWYSSGDFKVYDVKGQPDNLSLLKRKLFWKRYLGDRDLIFICRNLKYGGWIPYDELKALRTKAKKEKKKVEG